MDDGMDALPYTADVEAVPDREAETIRGIVDAMTREGEAVAKREGRATRVSHAKSTGCLRGTLEVAPGLPPELVQGLFAAPRRYEVAVRLAQGPGEHLPDSVSTHRGMAIKVFGVEGARIAGHDEPVQDFVLATGPTFPSGTAEGFLRDARRLATAAAMPAAAKGAVSSLARMAERTAEAAGGSIALADFYGHPFVHPLAEPYFSQAPMRWGAHVAKLGAFPATEGQGALAHERVDASRDPDAFRTATVAFLSERDAAFELRAQLWTDAATQPIEDASVEWPADASPYRTVATLRLPRQDAHSGARARFFDEALAFRPAHSLEAHRPLGSVMRARLEVYRALSAWRHERNGVCERDPVDPSSIPD